MLARKRSFISLRRKSSQLTMQTTSDQMSRDSRGSRYHHPDYELRLANLESHMSAVELGLTEKSKNLCNGLLKEEQEREVPQNTMFDDDLFDETCNSVQGRNEAMIDRDITPLICPSAQNLRIHDIRQFDILYEGVNET